jgi:hypothetical protein
LRSSILVRVDSIFRFTGGGEMALVGEAGLLAPELAILTKCSLERILKNIQRVKVSFSLGYEAGYDAVVGRDISEIPHVLQQETRGTRVRFTKSHASGRLMDNFL